MSAEACEIRLNGEAKAIAAGTTVAALLESLGLPRSGVAVEINTEVVPRATHAERVIAPGDTVEVVTFVGGG
ncbi:MAG: sulfur carrier protein ThiS [Planctomycetota bacterium]|jgi:sulfur carrier protein